MTLTASEIDEIALYTVQKIQRYPKSFGKTVENHFDLLFPDEIKAYLIRRGINETVINNNSISVESRIGGHNL